MDYLALPPEINSARMYLGPGSGSLMAAAAAWNGLAAELQSTAASYSSAVSGLTSQAWQGPSSAAMAAAAAPYLAWMTTTAAQAEQAGTQAMAAASAYEAAFAMTVPPPVIAANRSQLMSLIATNLLGQNTPAIAATEAQYGEMWAQDVAAMENYANSSAAASQQLTPFNSPPTTTNSAAAVTQAAAAPAAGGNLITRIPIGELGELDVAVTAGVGIAVSNLSLTSTNLARQFNRDALADAKDAAKGTTTPSSGDGGGGAGGAGNAGPGLGLGLRSTTVAPDPGAGRSAATVAASVGRGPAIGGLSVPPSWTASPEIRQLAKVLSTSGVQAAPVVMADDGESPYTGMALASLIGSGMGGLGARGGAGVNIPAPKPAAPKPAAKVAANPAANVPVIPLANTSPLSPQDIAAKLAATLAAMPGATIVVIPPAPATQ